ncbi:MAG: hypothetical protein KA028_00810 [Candidatus Pacebacteria bacterium]|nr:hypothetical protein [Candidatus Paceibacterota bacterium]MBP9852065.1 hypothetical protein [Candidatus Paceibacterota bacterium]
MKNPKNTLVIVAGAAGEIGTQYCKEITERGVECIGVIRNKRVELASHLLTPVICHLNQEQSIHDAFDKVDFSKYARVIYLHTIGVDKFDPRGYPNIKPMETIPADIYDTNVNSFKYLLRYCVSRINFINQSKSKKDKVAFKVAIVAGVADKHTPFVIESFCEAKFILKQYIQSCIGLYPDWVSGLSINISSTITQSAIAVRPNADTKYWLEPSEVVAQSMNQLMSSARKYVEIDIIKKSPDFFTGYYQDNKVLYEKWSKETGIK